jgi:hypothetical protein
MHLDWLPTRLDRRHCRACTPTVDCGTETRFTAEPLVVQGSPRRHSGKHGELAEVSGRHANEPGSRASAAAAVVVTHRLAAWRLQESAALLGPCSSRCSGHSGCLCCVQVVVCRRQQRGQRGRIVWRTLSSGGWRAAGPAWTSSHYANGQWGWPLVAAGAMVE